MKILKAITAKFGLIPHLYLLIGPYALGYFGQALNQLAMVVNGNEMPVFIPKTSWEGVCSDPTFFLQNGDQVHVCMTHATHLKFLCDWIIFGNPTVEFIMSPGDTFIFVASWLIPVAFYVWLALLVKAHIGGKSVVQAEVQNSGSGAPPANAG